MSKLEKVLVPDISGATDVDVIEIFVKPGDKIAVDDPLITLEGDKASMDVPSPIAGEVKEISLKVGDKVSEGSLILTANVAEKKTEEKSAEEKKEKPSEEKAEKKKSEEKEEEAKEKTEKKSEEKSAKEESEEKPAKVEESEKSKESKEVEETEQPANGEDVHAGPAVRRIAREFGIKLQKLSGTGSKGRITKEDVQKFVKQQLQIAESGGGATGGFSVLAAPKIDFKKFGEIDTKPLSKIKKISGANLHRNWVTIPHVTQFDEADITELEAFRQEQKEIAAKQGLKLTPLVFIMKAVVAALKQFPNFNSSLDESGENLIIKKYFDIGVAVDTPNGLVVPVIRDVDKKGMFELAKELADISKKAREKGLGMADMQGGCFTISSLGGIGGTAFTPIINAPEVAILGVSKSIQKPVYQTYGEFVPRLMLPLSLSYDHRVIDGADGARFIVYLSKRLEDIRTLLF